MSVRHSTNLTHRLNISERTKHKYIALSALRLGSYIPYLVVIECGVGVL